MENVQDMLNEVWTATIDSHKFDMFRNRIDMSLSIIDSGEKSSYRLSFIGVSTFYFVNGDPERRKETVVMDESA